MTIDTSNWKEFRLCDIFDIKRGGYNKKPEHSINGNIPFIGAIDNNNGVAEFYSIDDIKHWDVSGKKDDSLNGKLVDGNCIAVTVNGSMCNAYYQNKPFVYTHDVSICHLKNNQMNVYIGLFLCTLIKQDKFKWNYGRNPHDVKKFGQSIIKLPITQDGQPDWNYMEQFMKSLNWANIETKNKKIDMKLDVENWKEFRVGDLFDIKKGKRLTDENQTKGNVPYIGAIDSNNGVSNFIGQSPIHKGNTISLSYDGSIGEAFYQPEPFWCTDAVNVLYFKESNNYRFNQYIALFICSLLKQEKYRYTYGRKWAIEKMEDTIIPLPTTIDGQPNWEFMEQHIKSLPYGDLLN